MKTIAGCFLIFVLIIAVAVSGCTEKQPPTTTINYNVIIPTVAVTPVAPESTIQYVNSYGDLEWNMRPDVSDGFRIYTPKDWHIISITKSSAGAFLDSNSAGVMNSQEALPNVDFIYSPDGKGFIAIMGFDYSGTLYDLLDDKDKTHISESKYDSFIEGAKNAGTVTDAYGNNPITISYIERDENYYNINGNPARKATAHLLENGHSPISGDLYIIVHDSRLYLEEFYAL